MKAIRAIIAGLIVWALIFVEWTVLIFVPGLRSLGNWQFIIHYAMLVPITIAGISFYYGKNEKKIHGLYLGAVMLATGLILDALITLPFFVVPQGGSFVGYYMNPLMLIGYLVFLVVAFAYKKK
jgi:hypothetical protein